MLAFRHCHFAGQCSTELKLFRNELIRLQMHLSSNFYVNSVRVRGLEKALLEGLMVMVVGLKQRGCQEEQGGFTKNPLCFSFSYKLF